MKKLNSLLTTLLCMFLSAFSLYACDSDEPGEITKYKVGKEVHYKVVQLADSLTVNIDSDMNNFHILGNSSITYKSVKIVIAERTNENLKIYLSNVKLIGAGVVISCQGSSERVEIVAEGNSVIQGGTDSSAIEGIDDLVFTGNGKLTIIGGTGSAEKDGHTAIIGENITVDMDGTLKINGGNGANGTDGANGNNGTTASVGVGSTPGDNGGNGSNGTHGGIALSKTVSINIIKGSVKINGGSGGNGGKGGNGGNGGETSMIAQGQQPGGCGGNGGNAGHGGGIFEGKIYYPDGATAEEIARMCVNEAGENGIPGQGGDGGWSGGQRGSSAAKWQAPSGVSGQVIQAESTGKNQ